jgi:hypothetical protein
MLRIFYIPEARLKMRGAPKMGVRAYTARQGADAPSFAKIRNFWSLLTIRR